jgi:hypothetical protein
MEIATRIRSGHVFSISFQSITFRLPVPPSNSASMCW